MTIVEPTRILGAPRLPASVVVPPNVTHKLNTNSRLIIVHASRGHGKTTVVSWWLSRQPETNTVWLRLASDDLAVIMAELSASFRNQGLPDPQTQLDELDEFLVDGHRNVTVVLDDAHVLGEDNLEAVLTHLLGATRVRVMVLMRVRPAIVALRQLPWYVDEVTTSDLIFGPDEVRVLGAYRGQSLSHEEAATLVAQTCGWPGIISAVLSNGGLSPDLDWEAGSYYFEALFEVSAFPELNHLNLALGLPELVTDEMAQEMLAGDYPSGYLGRYAIEAPCPLLPRPVLGGYSLPPFLRGSAAQIFARRYPAEAEIVHARLSDISIANGDERAGLWHAVLASDATRIRQNIAQNWPRLRLTSDDLLQVGLRTLEELDPDPWLDGLVTFLAAMPHADKFHSDAYAALNFRIFDNAAPMLRVDLEQGDHWLRWAWAHVLHGMLTTAVHSFWQAAQLLPPTTLYGNEARLGAAYVLSMLGYIDQAKAWSATTGEPPAPRHTTAFLDGLRESVKTACARDLGSAVTGSSSGSAAANRELDTPLGELKTHAAQYLHPADITKLQCGGEGYSAEQLPTLEQREMDMWERQTLAAVLPSVVGAQFREIDVLRQFHRPSIQHSDTAQGAWSRAQSVRSRLVAGAYEDVVLATERCAEPVQDIPRPWMSMQLSRCIAAHRLGLVATAGESLHSAVAVAVECSLYSPFELIPTRELEEIAATVPNLLHTMHELNLLPRPGANRSEEEGLTPRELVVLRSLATGLTVRAIADVLYLSPNTVKTQLAGIYRKLRVTTRAEAVAEAKQRRLVVRLVAGYP